jgi:nucleoside-diphosphate-sugar epimerase
MHPKFEDIFGLLPDFSISSKLKPKSILITGAQGMLGNALAKAISFLQSTGQLPDTKLILLSREWEPKVVESWKTNKSCMLMQNSSISEINFPIEIVIHTASPSNITQINSYAELYEVNIGFLKGIRELNPGKIVYISTGEVYKGETLEEGSYSKNLSKSFKRDWYPIVKLEAELELKQRSIENEFSASSVRLFHTFGPGVKKNDGRSFADILWSAVLSKEIILKSRGNQVRSFLYLSDAIDAILKIALTNESGYKVINVGSNVPVSILEFAEMVSIITKSSISFNLQSDFEHSSNNYLVPLISNLNSYNWIAKVHIVDGIKFTVNWIKNSLH